MVREGLWAKFETMFRNFGWDVVVLRRGALQEAAFQEPGGERLREWIEACPNQLYSALTLAARLSVAACLTNWATRAICRRCWSGARMPSWPS